MHTQKEHIYRWMDRWKDGGMDRWTDGQANRYKSITTIHNVYSRQNSPRDSAIAMILPREICIF